MDHQRHKLPTLNKYNSMNKIVKGLFPQFREHKTPSSESRAGSIDIINNYTDFHTIYIINLTLQLA